MKRMTTQPILIAIFVGMMMFLGFLNIASAEASEPISEHISLNYEAITIEDSTGTVWDGRLTAELDLDHSTNQVTGMARLYLDGNTFEIQYNRVYELESGDDGRILELRGTSDGEPIITTLSVSPAGIVVIAVLML